MKNGREFLLLIVKKYRATPADNTIIKDFQGIAGQLFESVIK